MVKLRNVSPLGEIDLPLIGREGDNGTYNGDGLRVGGVEGSGCLERGEVFEVDEKTAEHLLEQVGNYELAEAPAPAQVEKDEATA